MITEHKSSNHSFSKDEKIKVRASVKIYQDNFYQTQCPQYTAPASGDLAHISTLVSTQIKKRYGRPKQSADSYHPLSFVFVCISISISLFIVSIFVFLWQIPKCERKGQHRDVLIHSSLWFGVSICISFYFIFVILWQLSEREIKDKYTGSPATLRLYLYLYFSLYHFRTWMTIRQPPHTTMICKYISFCLRLFSTRNTKVWDNWTFCWFTPTLLYQLLPEASQSSLRREIYIQTAQRLFFLTYPLAYFRLTFCFSSFSKYLRHNSFVPNLLSCDVSTQKICTAPFGKYTDVQGNLEKGLKKSLLNLT